MCLIFLAHQVHPEFPLILAANRDEFHNRPAARPHWWSEAPDVFAGKDLTAGGTWLGITRSGRLAAITNVREPHLLKKDAPSRGQLTTDFLNSASHPLAFFEKWEKQFPEFNGFNLLLSDGRDMYYLSNRTQGPEKLGAGIFGLSNAILDTPWPKVRDGKKDFEQAVFQGQNLTEGLFEVLQHADTYPDADLPSTGVPLELERALSARFIRTQGYGSRVSTVVLFGKNEQIYFEERSFVPTGLPVQVSFARTQI